MNGGGNGADFASSLKRKAKCIDGEFGVGDGAVKSARSPDGDQQAAATGGTSCTVGEGGPADARSQLRASLNSLSQVLLGPHGQMDATCANGGANSPLGATPLQPLAPDPTLMASQPGTSTFWQRGGLTSLVLPGGDDTIPIPRGVAAMMALAGFKTHSAAEPLPSPTLHDWHSPMARDATAASHTAPSLPPQQTALALAHSGNSGPWAQISHVASAHAGRGSNVGVAGADASVSCSGPQAYPPSAGTAATLEQQQQAAQMQLQQLQSFGSIPSMNTLGGLASLTPMAGISETNAMVGMSSLANLHGIAALPGMPGMSAVAGIPGARMGPLGAAGNLMGLGPTDFLPKTMEGDGGIPETLEQLLELQQGAAAAQQVQLLQQQQFRSQLRSFEAQQVAKCGGSSTAVARFKDKHRPMQMCRKLREFGYCVRGEECGFAHDTSELHPASSEFPDEGLGQDLLAQQAVPFLNADAPMQMRKKREMCIRLNKGGCLLNERCMYAHSPKELGTVALVITEDRVKIRICRHWEQGKCSYGNWCVNAHGMKEIGKMKPPEEFCPADRQARRE